MWHLEDLQAILPTAYDYEIGAPCTKSDVRRSRHAHLKPMKNRHSDSEHPRHSSAINCCFNAEQCISSPTRALWHKYERCFNRTQVQQPNYRFRWSLAPLSLCKGMHPREQASANLQVTQVIQLCFEAPSKNAHNYILQPFPNIKQTNTGHGGVT